MRGGGAFGAPPPYFLIMKTIGLIGGMSWESSAEYYRIINEEVHRRLGGVHSARVVLYSFDFAEIEELQHRGEWEKLTKIMIDAAKKLVNAGAEILLICTNTMHKMFDQVQENVEVPMIHIADATAEEIKGKGLSKVGLLGTKFTMEQDFYKKIFEKHGIETIIPLEEEREIIHRIIYNELVVGIIRDESRNQYLKIIENLKSRGAEGVVLGCTEIPLLIKQEHVDIPVFDTTRIHALKAVDFAI